MKTMKSLATLSAITTLIATIALISPSPRAQGAMGQGQAQPAASEESGPQPILLDECLVIPSVGAYGRNALYVDALVAKRIQGEWSTPQDGSELTRHDGETRAWQATSANEQGRVEDPALRGGYCCWPITIEPEQAGLYLMHARGPVASYINGQVRAGDHYSKGRALYPIELKAGENELLFHVARGRLGVELTPHDTAQTRAYSGDPAPALLTKRDATLASVIAGEDAYHYGALPLLNATRESLSGLSYRLFTEAEYADGTLLRDQTRQSIPAMPALSVRKQPFTYHIPQGYAGAKLANARLRVELWHAADSGKERKLDSWESNLHIAHEGERYDVTFLSRVDGSVQYYSVKPAIPLDTPDHGETRPGLVLSLHGAGVQARGQANSYANKRWCHVVAATNRRPFGFDWEDWGRIDALEVLAHAQARLNTDPARTYLTGHSMGGHGTHSVGVLFPDRFAAIGPSAGWIDFWSYGGGPGYKAGSLAQELLDRAANPSRTLEMIHNHKQTGVYLLHGDADDNVPIDQARRMAEELTSFHKDWDFHEQPGAGHWWNGTPGAGTGCVDWPPMFDFFARRRIPDQREVRELDFTTMNPGISASCYWATIEQQLLPLAKSNVVLRVDPWRRHLEGTSENVARLRLSLSQMEPGQALSVSLDDQTIEKIDWPAGGVLHLKRALNADGAPGAWSVTRKLAAFEKGPHRAGLFKSAFDNNMVFVYGTQGNDDENAWAYTKARFDAECWAYQGNGLADLVADVDFDPSKQIDRNVILYGNATTHEDWDALLGEACPLRIGRSTLSFVRDGEEQRLLGNSSNAPQDYFGGVFVYPRAGSESASVGVVTGNTARGMALTTRMRFFVSGAAWPDFFFVNGTMPRKGSDSVILAGYFTNQWTLPDVHASDWMVHDLALLNE